MARHNPSPSAVTSFSLVARWLLTSSFFLLSGSVCLGQEVEWRTDYATARREAAEKNRPLLIDIGSDNCMYCKKLDATTFRDPPIVSLMNEHFIPLKLNVDHDPDRLGDKLGVKVYPTLVFAGPDGKIFNVQPGYVGPAPLQEYLQHVLGATMTPDWMARDYQLAGQAIATSEYARAITLLKGVVQDGQERPLQLKARQLLKELEDQADGRLARARQLVDKGETTEALETTNEVVRVFSGTRAAVQANQMLTSLASQKDERKESRGRQAVGLFTQAQADFRAQHYLACLNRCETLSSVYGDQPEAAEAGKLANEIKNNPEWMRQACDSLGDQLGLMYLALAESWIKKGQPQQAALCLERVVQAFPGSRQAEMAQVRLSQIQGQPMRPVDFQKP